MVTGCIISRVSRTVSICSLISGSRYGNQHLTPHLRHYFHSLSGSPNKVIASQTGLQKQILNSNTFQRFGISSSTSPHFKVNVTSQNEGDTTYVSDDAKETTIVDPKEGKELGSNEHLSMEDIAKRLAKYNELLNTYHEQIEQLEDRLHHAFTELEHLKESRKRKEENSKKVAETEVGEPEPVDQNDEIKESQRGRSTSNQQIANHIIGACVYSDYLERYKQDKREELIKHKHDEPKDGKLEVEGRILTNPIKEEINNEDSGSNKINGDSGSPVSNEDSGSYTSNADSGSHISHEALGVESFYHIYF